MLLLQFSAYCRILVSHSPNLGNVGACAWRGRGVRPGPIDSFLQPVPRNQYCDPAMDSHPVRLLMVGAEARRDLIMLEGGYQSMSDTEDGDVTINARPLPPPVAPKDNGKLKYRWVKVQRYKGKWIKPHITKWLRVHKDKRHWQKYVYFCERCKLEVREERIPCMGWPVVHNSQRQEQIARQRAAGGDDPALEEALARAEVCRMRLIGCITCRSARGQSSGIPDVPATRGVAKGWFLRPAMIGKGTLFVSVVFGLVFWWGILHYSIIVSYTRVRVLYIYII
jgi:hypothetical protein